MPDGHVLYLCTGSQGEPRAALSRIAQGSHRNVKLSKGDVVIFSSKIIPGNEKGIYALQNELAEQGIEIVTARSEQQTIPLYERKSRPVIFCIWLDLKAICRLQQ